MKLLPSFQPKRTVRRPWWICPAASRRNFSSFSVFSVSVVLISIPYDFFSVEKVSLVPHFKGWTEHRRRTSSSPLWEKPQLEVWMGSFDLERMRLLFHLNEFFSWIKFFLRLLSEREPNLEVDHQLRRTLLAPELPPNRTIFLETSGQPVLVARDVDRISSPGPV